jgi:hypothetical protein
VSPGRCDSLISRDFIPASAMRPSGRQPSGTEDHCRFQDRFQEKLCGFFIKDRNFVMQDRVNEHLFFCKPSSPAHLEGLL